MTASQSGPGGRNLRACLVCSIILTQARFMNHGCPNCESYLFLNGRFDQVQECTSAIFEGLITLVDPEHSWVAKWQRLEGYVPGTYAVKVIGVLPDEVRQSIEDAGGRYVPRDGSEDDEL